VNIDLGNGLSWLGFWIFLSVFVMCDSWIYEKGHNTFLQTHKTDAEKELLRLKIEERKLNIELLRDKAA